MQFHWQNLNEETIPAKLQGRPRGSGFWHGRAWLRLFWREPEYEGWTIAWEWSIRWTAHSVGFHVDAGGEDLVGFHVGAFGLALWVHLQAPYRSWARRLVPREHHQLGVSDHGGCLFFNLWVDPMGGWDSRKRWWQQRTPIFRYVDVLLGKEQYSKETLETVPVIIPMPEGPYRGTCEVFESTWKRPRWFATRMIRTTVDIPGGIPHPGKGTQSYNCGDDALFGSTSKARTPEEAIAGVVESVLTSRARYGGRGWLPPAKRAKGGG